MIPYFGENYGNPSSVYFIGRESKKAIEESRQKIALAIGAKPSEIFFTSSGTEADNWAIKGVAEANEKKGKHIITSNIEHHAVLHTMQYLMKKGYEITFLKVGENGIINPEDVRNAIREDTILISIMYANNEIGTIQPIEEIGKIAKDKHVYFHTDAVQAIGSIPIDVEKLNLSMLSMSAHKFYGPKGIGVLYIRKGTKIEQFMHGGAQERSRRSGTENVPYIVGMGEAIQLSLSNMKEQIKLLNCGIELLILF